ncbi:MAG: Glycosylphosphatidylinositol (GPI) anchor assembly protein [Alyxoria varia]|nr:MAG: Glycosylphosphatidylinositol (GPI) anchor assembly protein [Alyxoria varia]
MPPNTSASSKSPTTSQTATEVSPNDPTSTKPSEALPYLHPTIPLPSTASHTFTHIHTALILALLYSCFSATVADPISSLTQLLLPVALLQGLWCGVCLPSCRNGDHGSSGATETAGTPAARKKGATGKSAGASGGNVTASSTTITGKIVPTLLSLILSLTLSTPPLYILAVLHGAPLTTHHAHTGLLAAHLALLTTPPLFYIHGVSAARWRALVSLAAPFDAPRGAAVGAIVGGWVGAVPIPLDWDREWQKWPVTVLVGVYLGWAVGKVVGGTVAWGRIIKMC